MKFLAFHPAHADLADKLARAVADHATPVGSGTVARTKRIPVEQRAEAAVIAWMRHQTTAYDSMAIPRIKGKRREVRRMLAQRSKELLGRYRRGEAVGEDVRSRRRWQAATNAEPLRERRGPWVLERGKGRIMPQCPEINLDGRRRSRWTIAEKQVVRATR